MDGQAHNLSVADENRRNVGKKRKTKLKEWKDRQRKILRDAGKPYTNRKGQEKTGKSCPKEGRACSTTCRKDCGKLTDERKLHLFNRFYTVPYEKQQALILSGLEQYEVKRRRKPEDTKENKRRKQTFKYHVQQAGQRLNVCKVTFMSVFQLTNSRLQVIQEKLAEAGEVAGSPDQATEARSPLEDGREKHSNRPHWIHATVKEGIKEHILSFPRTQNHYSRMKGDVHREYLSPDLNLLRMYRLYKENNTTSSAKFWVYRDIFKQQSLNFGFRHLPDSVLKRPAGLQITSVRWLKVTVEDPWNLYAKQSHSLFEGWKSWLISKPKQGATPQPPYFASHYPRAYESPLPIKKNKYQDLMTMLNYLPAAARSFYESLQSE